MTISMYSVSIPAFGTALRSLAHIIAKGEAHGVSLDARLAPDMYPLSRQVQIVSDTAKLGAARLAGAEVPSFPDTESNYAELRARIDKTKTFIDTCTAAQIDGSENKPITMKLPQGEMTFTGEQFLLGFVLPNLYFHVTTAYAILRQAGVKLGKMDYLRGG